jgi:hypothetical protein
VPGGLKVSMGVVCTEKIPINIHPAASMTASTIKIAD